MGQGPLTTPEVVFLLIGRGRLARHLHHYLSSLNLQVKQWHRQSPEPLETLLPGCSHVLLAIQDSAIETFVAQHPQLQNRTLVHFSGSLQTPLAWGCHPLMSFSQQLYSPQEYGEIHFIVDQGAPPFEQLLPGLPNPHHFMEPSLKARYHAECVLSGNFTSMLWSHFFEVLEARLGLPRSAALPYLRRIAANLESESSPLTGPLARGDRETVRRNLEALEGDPYQGVYSSFVSAFGWPQEKAS